MLNENHLAVEVTPNYFSARLSDRLLRPNWMMSFLKDVRHGDIPVFSMMMTYIVEHDGDEHDNDDDDNGAAAAADRIFH